MLGRKRCSEVVKLMMGHGALPQESQGGGVHNGASP